MSVPAAGISPPPSLPPVPIVSPSPTNLSPLTQDFSTPYPALIRRRLPATRIPPFLSDDTGGGHFNAIVPTPSSNVSKALRPGRTWRGGGRNLNLTLPTPAGTGLWSNFFFSTTEALEVQTKCLRGTKKKKVHRERKMEANLSSGRFAPSPRLTLNTGAGRSITLRCSRPPMSTGR